MVEYENTLPKPVETYYSYKSGKFTSLCEKCTRSVVVRIEANAQVQRRCQPKITHKICKSGK